MFEQVIKKEVRILNISAANGRVYARSDVSDSKGFLFIEQDGKIRLGIFPGADPEFGRRNLHEKIKGRLNHSATGGSFSLTGIEPRDCEADLSSVLSNLTSHSSEEVRGVSGYLQFIQDRTHYTNTQGADVSQETWNTVLCLRVYYGKHGTRPFSFTPGASGGYEAARALFSGKTLPPEHAEHMRDGTIGDFLVSKALAMHSGSKPREHLPLVVDGQAAAIIIRKIMESQIGFDKPSLRLEKGPLEVSLASDTQFDGVRCCGSYRYDDEGVEHDGKLKDLYSRTGAAEHNTLPTGNFRVSPTQDHGRLVLPHVICAPGDGFDLPKRFLHIRGISAASGQEQITLGPAEAYVDNQPISGIYLNTNARELLRNIAGVGDKSTLRCVKCFRSSDIFGCDIGPSLLFKPFSLSADYIR